MATAAKPESDLVDAHPAAEVRLATPSDQRIDSEKGHCLLLANTAWRISGSLPKTSPERINEASS